MSHETSAVLEHPTADRTTEFGAYRLESTALIPKPSDILPGYIAYNPSAVYSVDESYGAVDIIYVRVEPDRADASSSHLGHSKVVPYIIDINNPEAGLEPYEGASSFMGEDPALTKIRINGPNGIEEAWLLSFVDARPKPDAPNEVQTLCTRFYLGTTLDNLVHIADGPEWMKDIRIAAGPDPNTTQIEVFGRPQDRTVADNGNISHVSLASIHELNAEAITNASIISDDLFPVGSGIWGGVNDAIHIDGSKYVLAVHRAHRSGERGQARHYEAKLLGYDIRRRSIIDLGVLATASDFASSHVKDDAGVDTTDVIFTGGGYNGTLSLVTCGVRDGGLGIIWINHSN